MLGSCVRDREARADGQGRELIDRVAAGAPVRQLLLVEALGHARVPFAGFRPAAPLDILPPPEPTRDEKSYLFS
jgi:hypothetical protein